MAFIEVRGVVGRVLCAGASRPSVLQSNAEMKRPVAS